jgi:mono/diheme cytochrome c family protein
VNRASRIPIVLGIIGAFVGSVLVTARPVSVQDSVAAALPAGAGGDIARAACLQCHGSELITQQRLSRDGWLREIDKMVGWGAKVGEAEKPVLAGYLAAHFPDGEVSTVSAEPAEAGARVLQTRCVSCHSVDLIEQQRLDVAGWSREADKMMGWGAVLTPDEKTALVDYLARRFPQRQ